MKLDVATNIKTSFEIMLPLKAELFPCDKCDKIFKNLYFLKMHDQIHSPTNRKPYACKYCSMKFKMTAEVKIHENGHIGEEMPHSCRFCQKKFRNSRFLIIVGQNITVVALLAVLRSANH